MAMSTTHDDPAEHDRHDRHDRAIVWIGDLAPHVCWRYLAEAPIGRVAFVADGRPVVLPVNHVVDGRSVVFRAAAGSALGRLAVDQPVAFEVDDIAPDRQTGWSVLASGELERIPDTARRLVAGGGPHPWAPGPRDLWWRVRPRAVTGRAISRRRSDADGRLLPYMSPD
jgi:nitroimidazol reductase NimA-like FMN-containing flavoprotein (pyridoxamine 5'-phosphate oxidase superfamily)